MKSKHRHTLVIGFVILSILAACGKQAQSAPISNPSSVETALASTARALAQQTEAANGYTATPAVTPTETPTPTPKISLYGTSLITREDGSTLFVDHNAGVQLMIPAGWLPILANEDEYYKAFALDVVLENPPINNYLTQIQDLKPDYQRLDAIDIRPDHIPDGVISDISVIFDSEKVWSLEKWQQEEWNRKRPFTGYRVLSSNYATTQSGVKILISEQTWTAIGGKATVYYRAAFFSLPTGTFVLIMVTNKNVKDTILPEFEQVLNSITPFNP